MEKKKFNSRRVVYKKSVSTGQETFFPKEKIIARINTIIELKDEASLDELAERFSNNSIKNVYFKKKLYIGA